MVQRVEVGLGSRSYPVVFGAAYEGLRALLDERGVGRAVLVSETTVGPLWSARVQDALGGSVDYVELPAGEINKTVDNWIRCVNALLALEVDRHTTVIALGGGVLCDLVGFAAASVMRGVPCVLLPTTLLAMVDASVGGKTGVNHPMGKNTVGCFSQPIAVYMALGALETLPSSERASGFGEVIKTALIGDPTLFERLEREEVWLERDFERPEWAILVRRCVEIKAAVVEEDEHDRGRRVVLNAGHTVAHALERGLGYGALSHGEAVAMGLVAETAWAVQRGLCVDAALPARLWAVARRLGLRMAWPAIDKKIAIESMRSDKKANDSVLTLPVPRSLGVMIRPTIGRSRLEELWEHYEVSQSRYR